MSSPRVLTLGAFFNGVFLIALALSIFLQSLNRFVHLEVIEEPFLVLVIGCVGLALNSIGALVIHEHHHDHDHEHGQPAHADALKPEIAVTENSISDSVDGQHAKHNHTVNPPAVVAEHNLGLLGVLIHILGDTIDNIGVIIAAVIMWKTEPHNFESILCRSRCVSLISIVIFAGAVPLIKQFFLNCYLCMTSTSGIYRKRKIIMASLHFCVVPGTSLEELERIESILLHCFIDYGIDHVTISPELDLNQVRKVPNGGATYPGGCKRLSFYDEFGCSVTEMKKRLDEMV
ncbi:hypothetical protein NP233_g8434 [Leucocoprinus birnbaumii]|uniref:Cation efflux protein transmembrane domain-containing protein n=1 Tax=Leucocoprinus birnbaumii TaxID=56174 RepID=A0AAD5VMC2_9AGAR|nr:hypothetical protein NP233_g8434 [Leucocoprinus birnbaumii]